MAGDRCRRCKNINARGSVDVGRLLIAVADADAAYVDGLQKYFTYAYPDRFRTSTFTSRESLVKFISGYEGTIDILLVSPQLYPDLMQEGKVNTVIMLSSGRLYESTKAQGAINKYQHGDRIAAEIINIYSNTNKNEIISLEGNKKTRFVSVYSPAGGTGKTTIAISTSMRCAQKGLKVLYLNFENISTLPAFFDYKQSPNFSNVIYYLKDKEKNLGFKIEGIRCVDPESGLHFLAPPDSACELDELLPEDIESLLLHIGNMHYYDVVFMDMAGGFNRRSLSLMLSSDEIFLVTTQDEIANMKLRLLEKELSVLDAGGKRSLWEKALLIVNQSMQDMHYGMADGLFAGKAAAVTIPKVKSNMSKDWIKKELAEEGHFSYGINRLADRFVNVHAGEFPARA